MDQEIDNMIPVCKMCGRKLGQFVGMMGGEPLIICSSSYIEGWDYCEECMIDHCCTTNCFGCKFNPGSYKDCMFLDMKKNYLYD